MVMAFDEHGHQMPQYQGSFNEVAEYIAGASDDGTVFTISVWGMGDPMAVNRSSWFDYGFGPRIQRAVRQGQGRSKALRKAVRERRAEILMGDRDQ